MTEKGSTARMFISLFQRRCCQDPLMVGMVSRYWPFPQTYLSTLGTYLPRYYLGRWWLVVIKRLIGCSLPLTLISCMICAISLSVCSIVITPYLIHFNSLSGNASSFAREMDTESCTTSHLFPWYILKWLGLSPIQFPDLFLRNKKRHSQAGLLSLFFFSPSQLFSCGSGMSPFFHQT